MSRAGRSRNLKYRVIVADDEQELREAICEMVDWDSLGFELVGSAGNGSDALELVEKLSPDLIISDIEMPFISGIELARQVHAMSPSIRIAFLSGYDYFEYAKVAIRYNVISYMLKPLTPELLRRELLEIRNSMDRDFMVVQQQSRRNLKLELFLMPLILDAYQGHQREALQEKAIRLGLLRSSEDMPEYLIMVTAVNFPDGRREDGLLDESNVIDFVDQVIGKYTRSHSFFSNGHVISLLLGTREELREVHTIARELVEMVDRATGFLCKAGLSNVSSDLMQLHSLYHEAMEAVNYADSMIDHGYQNSIYSITDLRQDADIAGIPDLLETVGQAIRSGSAEALQECMERVFVPSQEHNRKWMDIFALSVVTNTYDLLISGEKDSNVAIPNCFVPRCSTAENLKENLTSFCMDAIEELKNRQKNGGSIFCDQAIEEINRNYGDESLSLVSVSEKLHVSPNYLSAVIRKFADDTFTNLLMKKRMEQAYDLLLTSNMKILEIAMHCGYSNQNYFSYSFKRHFGQSPNAVRRQLKNGGQ